MNSITRTALPILLLTALFCGTAFSQEKGKKHTCRILFLERPDTAPLTLHLFDGTTSREVDLPGMNLSKVYELPPGPLTLALLPFPLDNLKDLPSGAPTAKVPEGVTDFYLILTQDPANKVAQVSMNIVNAGDKIRRGETLWLNLTNMTVGGQLGSERLLVRPKSRTITGAPAKGNEDYPVSLGYQMEGEEKVHPICQTSWVHNSRDRGLGIIFKQGEARLPRVQVFADFRPENEEKNTAQP